ncbi:ATP-binding protein [Nocardiopsis ganjiahuensis]|uniref:ATP-binding protein n=1 Tax=Nocardiopsis ganjiahuensis TaxID=239984 RepID=UPI0003749483|nr:ATP-binding protein [Nocardiopsis ganjiahuensis]
MAIVPHPHTPLHTPATPYTGRRWPSRIYPGELARTAWMRTDLAVDLSRLAGMDQETIENMVLCASEMFANACDHSRSGQDPEGRIIRTLHMPTHATIQVAIVDDGNRTDIAEPTGPKIPHERTLEEWEQAERGRGLLLIHYLAERWGTRSVLDFPFCAGLGTVIWAEFTLGGGQA